MTKIFGIDLSTYDGKVDFNKLKESGVEFVILRCGYASLGNRNSYNKDIRFETYYSDAKAAGILVGTYFYSMLNGPITGKAEAEYILTLIKGKQFEYPIWLDVENESNLKTNSKDGITTGIETCLEHLKSNGYYVGIYTGKYLINDYMVKSRIDKYDLWIAQWSKSCSYDGNLCMWQFGGETNLLRSVKIDGVSSTSVDQSYSYKDYPTIIKSKGSNGYDNMGEVIPDSDKNGDTNTEKDTSSSINSNIKSLQVALNKSYNCGLATDGLYGPLTKAQVKKHYLKSVTKNEHVKWFQNGLKTLGYSIIVDGSYGPKTTQLVKAFQKKYSLTADGIAGIDTHTKLISLLKK